jgi:hypothetical protein
LGELCRRPWRVRFPEGLGDRTRAATYNNWQDYRRTLNVLRNPLRVAVEAGDRHGIEVYGYFKPYETGPALLLPEGSPQAKADGLLPHLGAQLAWLYPFVIANPHLRIRRRDDDGVTGAPSDAAVCAIKLVKHDDSPTRVTREHLQNWTSPDNYHYRQADVSFNLTESVPVRRTVRNRAGGAGVLGRLPDHQRYREKTSAAPPSVSGEIGSRLYPHGVANKKHFPMLFGDYDSANLFQVFGDAKSSSGFLLTMREFILRSLVSGVIAQPYGDEIFVDRNSIFFPPGRDKDQPDEAKATILAAIRYYGGAEWRADWEAVRPALTAARRLTTVHYPDQSVVL